MSQKRGNCNPLYFLVFLLLMFSSSSLHSQDARALLMEPVVRVIINDEKPWSYAFGIAHRGILLEVYDEDKLSGYSTEHLEINHYTQYRLSKSSAVSLRFRYRNNEWFNDNLSNEARIIQEYKHAPENSFLNLWHRLRFEQKFFNNLTAFRGRYRIGISRRLTPKFSLGASTEALYSVSAKLKPEPEQRFMLNITNSLFEDVNLDLGLEYRWANYTANAVKHYFLFTSATFFL